VQYDVPLEGYDKLDEGDRKTVDTQREKNKGKAPEGKKRSPKSPKQPKKEVKEKVYAVDSVKSTRCKCFTCGESFKSMETAIGQKSAGGFKSRFHIPCFPIVIEDTATIVDFDKLSADGQCHSYDFTYSVLSQHCVRTLQTRKSCASVFKTIR